LYLLLQSVILFVCQNSAYLNMELNALIASVRCSAVISVTVPIPYFASDSLVFSGTQPALAVLHNCVHSSVIVALCSGTQ
jgi:hypothetical protein